jgi:hypothetical protein
MTWEQTRLTQLEESTALARAGIDPDMATWDNETLDHASAVLDVAQAEKMVKLYPKSDDAVIRAREAKHKLTVWEVNHTPESSRYLQEF